MRAGLLARAGLTDAEVDLLRRHAAGIGSRLMARGLQAEAEMIDRRFQRILSKLGTASQRRAARLVKPCSLIWRLPGRPKPDVRANCRGAQPAVGTGRSETTPVVAPGLNRSSPAEASRIRLRSGYRSPLAILNALRLTP